MAKSSSNSAKKVAKLASSGKRRTGRGPRQQGLLFPVSLVVTFILGVALVLAANAQQSEAQTDPGLEDHWHAAYGVYFCDRFLETLPNAELPSGVHTHGDGVVHIHPFSSRAIGQGADLGLFLAESDIAFDDSRLEWPGQPMVEGETTCGDQQGELRVLVWDDAFGDGEPQEVRREDLADTWFYQDRMAVTIAFVPSGTADADIPRPPSVPELDQLTDLFSEPVPGGPTETTPTDTATATDTATDTAGAEGGADAPPTTASPGTTAAPTTAAPSTSAP